MNFVLDDNTYEIIIEKKNNKNLYIRVTDDLKIKVTVPYLYTKKMIEKVLLENKRSIKRMIEHQINKNEKKKIEDNCLLGKKINIVYKPTKKPLFESNNLIINDDKMIDKWYKKVAIAVFKDHLDIIYSNFNENIVYPKLKIREMKTRWGVCNRRDNSITLNLELIKKDEKYLNYVIVHELSHFVHFNHSKLFWKLVEKYCPKYKEIRNELKE